jgi:hypothetical protein
MEKSYGPLPSIVEENNPRDLALCGLKQWVFLFENFGHRIVRPERFPEIEGPIGKKKNRDFHGRWRMRSSNSDPDKFPRQKDRKEKNLKEAEIGKVPLNLSLCSALDYFLRLTERCAEQGKITPKEYSSLLDLCGNLGKNTFKIGEQRTMEREVPAKFTTRILKP